VRRVAAHWNREAGTARYFMSAEDLTTQAGLAVQQDLALVNLLGITHVERDGHHCANADGGPGLRPSSGRFSTRRGDLYEHSAHRARFAWPSGTGGSPSARWPAAALPAPPWPDFGAMRPMATGRRLNVRCLHRRHCPAWALVGSALAARLTASGHRVLGFERGSVALRIARRRAHRQVARRHRPARRRQRIAWVVAVFDDAQLRARSPPR
jgi:hypothetical protein